MRYSSPVSGLRTLAPGASRSSGRVRAARDAVAVRVVIVDGWRDMEERIVLREDVTCPVTCPPQNFGVE
jgi:hypothetical protein